MIASPSGATTHSEHGNWIYWSSLVPNLKPVYETFTTVWIKYKASGRFWRWAFYSFVWLIIFRHILWFYIMFTNKYWLLIVFFYFRWVSQTVKRVRIKNQNACGLWVKLFSYISVCHLHYIYLSKLMYLRSLFHFHSSFNLSSFFFFLLVG